VALETISKQRKGGGKFLKTSKVFAEPGDKFAGIYRGAETGKYGLDVTFETERGDVILTVKPATQEDLEEADVQPGNLVVLTFLEAVPSKKFPHPWKKIGVQLDRGYQGKPPANGDNVWGDD
jgi:hypothetical protein